jgi:hypothetical protein
VEIDPQTTFFSNFLLIVSAVKEFENTNKNVNLGYPVLPYVGSVFFGPMDKVGEEGLRAADNFL